jgi:GR25 family glycosyltransferase involved in LPS biosynthesis
LAWLGHLDLLKFVIQSKWNSALILEDDVDWDVDVRKHPGSRKQSEV